jgi:hypothetical protein
MTNRVLIDDATGSADHSTLSIHFGGLSDVATVLRQEVDGNLVGHITQLHSGYHGCLVQVTKLLSGYVQAGDALATAIDTMVQRYGSSDAMAHAQAEDVSRALADADQMTPRTDLMAVEQFSRRAGAFG